MLCLLGMCPMEELQELPPSSTVLGNFGASWIAGVMNCVLRALNSEIMNFRRFLLLSSSRWWGRDKWREGAAGAARRVTSALWIGCQWHHFIIQPHVCISASPSQGPPDLTQLLGAERQRVRAAPDSGTTAGEQGPSACSGAGNGHGAGRPSRGHGLQQELKQNP